MRKIGSQKKDGFLDRLVQMVRIKSAEKSIDPEAKPANIVYSSCCHPLPGDTIVGELLDDGSVSVHLANCPLLGSVPPERLINTNWEVDKNEEFEVAFKIAAEDRPNLLYEMIKVMNSMNVNLSLLEIKSENSIAIGNFVGKVKSLNHFIKIRKKLFAVPGVLSIERFVQ
jgi:GTP diphosphokinase / guanosine-3',5'-bis(diphosphate) 3'-diphosphatase